MTTLTYNRWSQILNLPLALPQTELRRGRSLQVAAIPVALGESVEVRALTLHLLRLLTPGVSPVLNNSALGLCSVGIYLTDMLTGGTALVKATGPGAEALNPYAPAVLSSPGFYRVIVANNTSNVDLAVVVSGVATYTS